MNILSRQYISTTAELTEWLEDLNFTVEVYYNRTRFRYNLDDTETWFWASDVSANGYCYAIELYNNGILISNGLNMTSTYFAFIAPENEDDSWVCDTTASGGNLLVQKNIPNSGLQLSHDSIKLEQYYEPQTEEMTLNKYFMNIIPYRSTNWVYQSGFTYLPLTSHIHNYYRDNYPSVGQIVEVTINEKTFILIIRDDGGSYYNDMYSGSKKTVALRIA